MDNETTMPGLLTLPGTLDEKISASKSRLTFYRVIIVAAVLALALGLCLY